MNFFSNLPEAKQVSSTHTAFGDTLVVACYDETQVNDLTVGRHFMQTELERYKQQGKRLIQLWQSEVANNPVAFKKMVLSAAGLDVAPFTANPSVGARSCDIDTAVSWNEAKSFYSANHPQGATASLHNCIGLRRRGDLVAVMSFSMSADRRGAAANSFVGASLTRYATAQRVAGGASKLLNAWRAANPGSSIMSYSDPRMFTGDLYKTLGFTLVKTNPPDYLVYNPFTKELRHKSAYQRKNLERWRLSLGRTDIPEYIASSDLRTEFQMEDAMGLLRVYQAGLLRWELHP